MRVLDVVAADGVGEDGRVLRLAGAVEAASEHPVGRAVAAAASSGPARCPPVDGFANVAGARRAGRGRAGTPSWSAGRGCSRDVAHGTAARPDSRRPRTRPRRTGRTAVAVGWDGSRARPCSSSPTPSSRPPPRRSRQLRDLGLTPMLLTGDNEAAARDGGRAGRHRADASIAEVLPADKVAVVRRLQAEGTGRRHGRRRRQRRRRAGARPTWAWPWAPAPTSRSRPAT